MYDTQCLKVLNKGAGKEVPGGYVDTILLSQNNVEQWTSRNKKSTPLFLFAVRIRQLIMKSSKSV